MRVAHVTCMQNGKSCIVSYHQQDVISFCLCKRSIHSDSVHRSKHTIVVVLQYIANRFHFICNLIAALLFLQYFDSLFRIDSIPNYTFIGVYNAIHTESKKGGKFFFRRILKSYIQCSQFTCIKCNVQVLMRSPNYCFFSCYFSTYFSTMCIVCTHLNLFIFEI